MADEAESPGFIRAQLDLPGLVKSQHEALRQAISEASGRPTEQIIISYSHSHAAGWFVPESFTLPGGDLIEPYLADVGVRLQDACRRAIENRQPVVMTYGTGRCSMAANRDYWDADRNLYACGYNPEVAADDTL